MTDPSLTRRIWGDSLGAIACGLTWWNSGWSRREDCAGEEQWQDCLAHEGEVGF